MTLELGQIVRWLLKKFPDRLVVVGEEHGVPKVEGEIPCGTYTIPLGRVELPCEVEVGDDRLRIGHPYCVTYARKKVDDSIGVTRQPPAV